MRCDTGFKSRDGTPFRFGWTAQNPSSLVMSVDCELSILTFISMSPGACAAAVTLSFGICIPWGGQLR